MLDKQNDPISIEKKIKISPIDYSKLNKIKEDFGKHFVTQKELSAEQAFWLKHSSLSETPVKSHTPVRIEAPSELPKCGNVKKDIDEIETINIELEQSVAKLLSENENLRKEQENLKSIYEDQFDSIRKIRVQSKEHCDSLIAQINAKSVENSDLNAQLQEKVFAITSLQNELRKLKGKNVVNTMVSKPNANVAPGMFKLDIEPISPRLKNNRDAYEVYIEKTIEYTDTLCGFVESARSQNPSEPLLESSCIGKLVAVTPMNKDKRVRFDEPITSSSNKPLLTSTGVKSTTSASRSKPSGNTKNNMITRPPSSNQKNKVEDHSRKVKSSLNKTNYVSEPISNALVKHYNLEGVDLLSGSRDTKFYTISLDDMLKTSPICLLSKALKSKSWLWHRRLSYLNFDTLNKLAKDGLARDAPSSSIPSTQEQEHSPIISQRVKESPKTPLFHDDPLHEFLHEDSTSQGSSSNVRPSHTPFELIGRWTKDHLIANVISDPSRSVSTKKQLKTDAMWCYFDAFLTSVEPKNFKHKMTEPSWIDAMQEEIHEF
ncbi:retrovirus-related pol polyprotein from transposon TNT 1-94 [Tanacetum coccineum]|uniref:Retrovirus-related pol polyprotein from transposon TNT 1-94 n=1 Tax=Tanacetum coccineum TaxID=301880 RepID=A0ABQ4YYX2_9ASTR